MALVKQADDLHLKGSYSNRVSMSLERLRDADLVTYKSGSWRVKSLNEIFAVRRLITIEAKVSAWNQGLHQAFYNTWFASESYLLIPHIPKASRLLDEAERFGIGVVTHDQHLNKSAACARKEQIPKSYASWLFNEWVWRAKCFVSYKLSINR